MNKEMKSKRDVREMKRGWWLRVVVLSLILLSTVSVTLARPASPSRAMLGGCSDVKICLQQIMKKISQLRAIVRHVNPGDPVEFTQQAREASPQYRQEFETYKSLQEEFSSLSESSPWGRSKWTWSQDRIGSWKNTVSEAEEKLNRLGQSSDRRVANMALNDLSESVQKLSRMVNSRSR